MECRKCHFIILFTPGDYSEFHINPTEADQESEVKWFTVNLLRHGFDQDLNATLTPTTTINQSEQRSLESGCCLAGVMTPCRDYPYSGCSPAKSLAGVGREEGMEARKIPLLIDWYPWNGTPTEYESNGHNLKSAFPISPKCNQSTEGSQWMHELHNLRRLFTD